MSSFTEEGGRFTYKGDRNDLTNGYVPTGATDLEVGPEQVVRIVKAKHPGKVTRYLYVETEDYGTILLEKRALRLTTRRTGAGTIKDLLDAPLKWFKALPKPLIISAIPGEEGRLEDWYAFRVTFEPYVEVPNETLFKFVEGVIKEAGIPIVKTEAMEWNRRTGMYFMLQREVLNYQRPGDSISSGLLVTNENTAEGSVRVFDYASIQVCANGLVSVVAKKRIPIVHRGDLKDLLKQVGLAVTDVLKQMVGVSYATRIERLLDMMLDKTVIENWLKLMMDKTPKKYRSEVRKYIVAQLEEFGANRLALYQAVTRYGMEFQERNVNLAREYQKEAQRLLTAPEVA